MVRSCDIVLREIHAKAPASESGRYMAGMGARRGKSKPAPLKPKGAAPGVVKPTRNMASLIYGTAQFLARIEVVVTLNPALRKDGGRLQVDLTRRGSSCGTWKATARNSSI
jgi:hypothetical protein